MKKSLIIKSLIWVTTLLLSSTTFIACSSTPQPSETQSVLIPTPTPLAQATLQPDSEPRVVISSPRARQQFEAGQQIAVASTAVDPEGIVRVELMVNNRILVINENSNPQPNAPFSVSQVWQPQEPGVYVLQVQAFTSDRAGVQSEPLIIQVFGAEAPTPAPLGATVTPGSTATPSYAYLQLSPTIQLPVRAIPDLSAPPIGNLTAAEPAPIVGRYEANGASWWQIVFAGGQSGLGWVLADPALATAHNADGVRAVQPLTEAGPPTATSTPPVPEASPTPGYPYLIVTAVDRLNVRSGPSTQYQAIAILSRGQTARITGQADIGAGRWWQIDSPNGWVVANRDFIASYNSDTVPQVSPPPAPASPTPAPVPTPSQPQTGIDFGVSRTTINYGECIEVGWNVTNVREVYLNGQGVPGDNQIRRECPAQTTVYSLRVVRLDGSSDTRYARVEVLGGQALEREEDRLGAGQYIDFDADDISNGNDDDEDYWYDGSDLRRAHDDDDLDLAKVTSDSDDDDLERLGRDDCIFYLNNDQKDHITAQERRLICFRTDEDRIGKLRFEDVGDDSIEIHWFLWR